MMLGSSFVTALDRAGYRLTGPRRAVAELIAGADGHFTAADLAAEAASRRQPIGRATIFRALELFTDLGLVERLDLPTGEHAYVACDPRHHHHAVCGRCGRSAPVDDDGIDALLETVAGRTGYRIDEHRLEVYGTCPACLRAERETGEGEAGDRDAGGAPAGDGGAGEAGASAADQPKRASHASKRGLP